MFFESVIAIIFLGQIVQVVTQQQNELRLSMCRMQPSFERATGPVLSLKDSKDQDVGVPPHLGKTCD